MSFPQRPRSAPETVRDAISRATTQPICREESLSAQWNPRRPNVNPRHDQSSSGSSRNEPRTSDELKGTEGPWAKKTLLCLDGGGVRGYSSLLILRTLMKKIADVEKQDDPLSRSSVHPLHPRPRRRVRIRRNETFVAAPPSLASASMDYLPAHYFDYMAGTSTGGLIAIMLGRLHMSVDECLEVYENLAQSVFAHPRRFHMRKPPFVPRDKYDHKPLEKVIKEIVRERNHLDSSSTLFRQPNEEMCRTIVIAWRKLEVKGARVPYLFRSYRHPRSMRYDILERNPDGPDNYKIWEVGRATSAAPFYFKAMKLEEDDDKAEYIDGGFGANNPAEEAYRAVKQMSNNNEFAVKMLLSIGTGKNTETDRNPSAGYALYLLYANAAAKWATQSEATHERVYDSTRGKADYVRLNVEHGIGKMKLDEWKGKGGSKTLNLIRTKTQEHLSLSNTQQEIAATARRLVDIRQARSTRQLDADRWERFCHGVEYACCVDTCQHGGKRFSERQALRQHLEVVHPCDYDASRIEDLLDQGKSYPPETTSMT